MQQLIQWFIFGLPYAMGAVFAFAVLFRYLIYRTVHRHEWFAKEFEKRVNKFLEGEEPGQVRKVSFFVLSKKLLERTYFEIFEIRDRANRRRGDRIMSLNDRVFLVKQGCAWLVRDILRQIKFLKYTNDVPKLLNITKSTFMSNPCFNRVFGIVPIATLNDFLSILPGLFVVAGILGTFLGIRGGLGGLGGMDLNDIETTKSLMDNFLNEIAFAMTSSIAGITFSLALHIWNVVFSPERLFVDMIDRFDGSLSLLWYRSDNNEYPCKDKSDQENADPAEALAESALEMEVAKSARTRDLDKVRKVKTA